MAEIRTVTTLRRKRKEIAASIQLYERSIAQARADLAHIEAAIAIFAATGSRKHITRYVDTLRPFRRGEAMERCWAALADESKTTLELAPYVMKAKGLDPAGKLLTKSVAPSLSMSYACPCLRMEWRRGRLKLEGKRCWVLVLGVFGR